MKNEVVQRGDWRERLREFQKLEDDWNSYGAQPISLAALKSAYAVCMFLEYLNAPILWLVPTVDGGVSFEAHRTDFTIEADGTVNCTSFTEDWKTTDSSQQFPSTPSDGKKGGER